ncbi:hypothetical protein JZ751_004802 [Albula glossodonta]|uniref:Uncharacterized protein n=1 Tax=Albula glossodonta TaxID=121402 RepID=A0A8T2P3U6_9TELE|nr:hypothetical protein JZ751_004802 [Albula glossodonta]
MPKAALSQSSESDVLCVALKSFTRADLLQREREKDQRGNTVGVRERFASVQSPSVYLSIHLYIVTNRLCACFNFSAI